MNSTDYSLGNVSATAYTDVRTTTEGNQVTSPKNEVSYGFNYSYGGANGSWTLERSSNSGLGISSNSYVGDWPNSGGQNTANGETVPLPPQPMVIGTLLDWVFTYGNANQFVDAVLTHPNPIRFGFGEWSKEYVEAILPSLPAI